MRVELLEDVDIRLVVAELSCVGGVSVSLLPAATRALLLAEALSYVYERRESVVGPAGVRQDLSGFDRFMQGSLFFELRDQFQRLLTEKLEEHPEGPTLFSTTLHFNDLSLQRYEPGSLGITPHRDQRSRINLVCVFPLIGRARFCLCADRTGTNPIELDSTPGRVILLRAPGFRGSDERPFHFLSDIPELRIAFGLRQKR